MTTNNLTLSVRTLRHVPLEDALAPLSEELFDLVIDRLAVVHAEQTPLSGTLITARTLLGALETAEDEFKPDAAEKANCAAVVDALKALPQDVFISLGG